jgi:Type II secretion system (T2SS), protein G
MRLTFALPGLFLFSLPACSVYVGTRKHIKDIVELEEAVTAYALRHGYEYPASLERLVVPDEAGVRYLEGDKLPVDPWGNAYGYERSSAKGTKPRIFSYGSDGVPGGKGSARDIDNYMISNGEVF